MKTTALIMMLALGAAAHGGQRTQTAEEAIAADARMYARDQGVSQEEAVRRLRIQQQLGGTIGSLRTEYRSRLAGIAIEHKPVYRVRVRLTGNTPVANRVLKIAGSELPIVFETGAAATVEELVAAMTAHQAALLKIYPNLAGMGTDERTGEIVLVVNAADAPGEAQAKLPQARALLGMPVRLEITNAYPTH